MRYKDKEQFHNKKIKFGERQRKFLRGNKKKSYCPSLCYNYIEGEPENIDRAFDLLFEAVLLQDENK